MMTLFSTIPRYFARTFLLWFGVVLFTLTSTIVLFDFSELLRRSSKQHNVEFNRIAQMVLLKLPNLLELLLPFIILFACMFTLWRLNRQNEVCASRTAGLSIWQMLSPFLFISLLIGFVDLFVVNHLSSSMQSQYNMMNDEFLHNHKGGISISKNGIWLRYASDTGPIMLRVGQVNVETKRLMDLTIFEYDNEEILKVHIKAKTADFMADGLTLNDVWVSPYHETPAYHEHLSYHTALSLSHIQDNKRDPETMSFWELPAFIDLLDESGLSSVKYRLYYQSLIARAIWLMTMVLLAATCTLRPIRQGKQFLFILPATLIGFSLYFLRDITYSMGQSSTIPIGLAAWSPVAITGMIGLVTLLHLEEH
jgi:lipopolysaccharide export system permease protein